MFNIVSIEQLNLYLFASIFRKKSLLTHFIPTFHCCTSWKHALHEKCPNTEFFLVRIFPHTDCRIQSECGKIRTRKDPVFRQFHTVMVSRGTLLQNGLINCDVTRSCWLLIFCNSKLERIFHQSGALQSFFIRTRTNPGLLSHWT